jgi:hypothetical protein
MPAIGRAKLEEWLDQASERGRFDHADRLYAEWQKLGPETKRVLFGSAAQVDSLDRFFLLAKRIGENPNPSGTAPTLLKSGEITVPAAAAFSGSPAGVFASLGASLTMGGVAKLLYSPAGVRALTKLLQASPGAALGRGVTSVASRAAWVDLANAARAEGIPVQVPQAADRDASR